MKARQIRHAFTKAECERLNSYLKREGIIYHTVFQLGINSSFFYTELSRLRIKDLKKIVSLMMPNKLNSDNLLEIQFEGRTVFIHSKVKDILTKFIENSQYKSGESIAFCNRLGRPFRNDIISHYLEYWCEATSCKYGSLRKTFFRNLYNSGVSLYKIQNYLNYTSLDKTKRYLNLSKNAEPQCVKNVQTSHTCSSTSHSCSKECSTTHHYADNFNELQLRVVIRQRDREIRELKSRLEMIQELLK